MAEIKSYGQHAAGTTVETPDEFRYVPGIVWLLTVGGIEQVVIGVYATPHLGKERALKSIRLAGTAENWMWTESVRQWQTTDYRWHLTEYTLESAYSRALVSEYVEVSKSLSQMLEAMRGLYTALERSSPADPGHGEIEYRRTQMDTAKAAISTAEKILFPFRTVEAPE